MRNFPNNFYPDVSRVMPDMRGKESVASKIIGEAMDKVIAAENSVIIKAVKSYFGNDDFENNGKSCRTETDPKSNAKRVFHGDTLICEIHPLKTSGDGNGIINLSFSYR